jgi:hypothetical protein
MATTEAPPRASTDGTAAALVAELRRKLAEAEQRAAQLDAARKEADHAERAVRGLLLNKGWSANQVRVFVALLAKLGAAPGRPNTGRAREFVHVTAAEVAALASVSADTAGAIMAGLVDADYVRRQRRVDRLPRLGRDGQPLADDQGRPQMVAVTFDDYAPLDGAAWVELWRDPAHLPPPPEAERKARNRARSRQREVEQRAEAAAMHDELAALRAELAQLLPCSGCGSTSWDDLQRRCTVCGCGTITTAAEVDDQPADQPLDRPVGESLTDEPMVDVRANGKFRSPPDSTLVGGNFPLCARAHAKGAAEGVPDPLGAAVAVLAPIFSQARRHTQMQARQRPEEPKHLTRKLPLTPALIQVHLQGKATYGAMLIQAGGVTQALAWDADRALPLLIAAAGKLRAAGLVPLLVKNPSKESSGHLWLLLNESVALALALAAAERIAPELGDVPERFPNLDGGHAHPIRLPGGRYLPVGVDRRPVPVLVAAAPEAGEPAWVEATRPEGWALIAASVTTAAILTSTYVPPHERPAPSPPPRRAAPARTPVDADGANPFAAWALAHPVETLVQVERGSYFKASWRDERTASVHLYPDGHWHDYGGDHRHGVDSFDLWCSLHGHWDEAANKPRRVEAARALGLLPAGGAP